MQGPKINSESSEKKPPLNPFHKAKTSTPSKKAKTPHKFKIESLNNNTATIYDLFKESNFESLKPKRQKSEFIKLKIPPRK